MRLLLAIALIGTAFGATTDRHADFAGTWRMDPARSESAHQDIPDGASTLVIQVSGDKLTMETTRDEGGKPGAFHETLTFKTDGSETTSTGDSNVAVTGKAHWDGAKLVVETVRNIQDSTVTTLYVHTLNPRGAEMIIDKTLTVQHGYMGQHAPTSGHGKDVFVRVSSH